MKNLKLMMLAMAAVFGYSNVNADCPTSYVNFITNNSNMYLVTSKGIIQPNTVKQDFSRNLPIIVGSGTTKIQKLSCGVNGQVTTTDFINFTASSSNDDNGGINVTINGNALKWAQGKTQRGCNQYLDIFINNDGSLLINGYDGSDTSHQNILTQWKGQAY